MKKDPKIDLKRKANTPIWEGKGEMAKETGKEQ